MELKLRVIPNASRDEIVGWIEGSLKIKVQAPPEGGRANRAVVALLAKRLEVRERQVHLVSGENRRQKVVSIDGVDESALGKRLPFKPDDGEGGD